MHMTRGRPQELPSSGCDTPPPAIRGRRRIFAKKLRSAHFINGSVGVLQNVELVVHDAAVRAHCSMLLVNGRHMSTHPASMRFLWLSCNCVRKNSSNVSCLRARPNHNGSPVSKLLTTVMNLVCLPK
jgi:hypothetical protein